MFRATRQLRFALLLSAVVSQSAFASDVILKVVEEPAPGPGSTYRVLVEASSAENAPILSGVSFALAIPAGGQARNVELGPAVWDGPVESVYASAGGLRCGAVVLAHDLATGPCEILRFQKRGSTTGMAFVAELDGTATSTIVSTEGGASYVVPSTLVLDGDLVVPEPTAPVPASGGAEAASMGLAGPESGGEGGGAALGASVLPCDAVEIVKALPPGATTLNVPGAFPNIQAAVTQAALLGGTVVISVGPSLGTPYPPVAIDLVALTNGLVDELYIVSTDGPAATVIQGTATQRPVSILGMSSTVLTTALYFGTVIADDPDLTDHTNWRGFRLQSDPSAGPSPLNGGGLRVLQVPERSNGAPLEIRGNEIVNCSIGSSTIDYHGGGVSVESALDVALIRNEIGNNTLLSGVVVQQARGGDGAGLHVIDCRVTVVSNWIHGNEHADVSADIRGAGGGVYFIDGALDLCGNLIENNQAKSGCGIHATLDKSATVFQVLPRFFARDNIVRANSAWSPTDLGQPNTIPFLGGGLYLTDAFDSSIPYELTVLSNQFTENSIGTPVVQPAGTASAGGGAFVDIKVPVALGFTDTYPAFESNLVQANSADLAGGGLWLFAGRQPGALVEFLRFYNNTITLNAVPVSGEGSGAFLAGFDSRGGPSYFDGSSNLLVFNEEPLGGAVKQGFAECPDTGSTGFRYSQVNGTGGTGCSGAGSNVGDWDLSVGTNNSAADPVFILDLAAVPTGRVQESSPCGDSADPTIDPTSVGTIPVLATSDFDGEARLVQFDTAPNAAPTVDLDRGGDEIARFTFVRGDTNADNAVNIADMVHLLSFLFNGADQMNCLDAYDCDDSGVLDLADAIFGLSIIVPPSPQPSPPIPMPLPSGFPGTLLCGVDPTFDSLVCDQESSFCP